MSVQQANAARDSQRDGEVYSWEQVLMSSNSFASLSFGTGGQGIVTGVDERFWVTFDEGNSWRSSTVRGEGVAKRGGAYNLTGAVITPSSHIYVLGQLEEVGSAIFSSPDKGNTWNVKNFSGGTLNDIYAIGEQIWAVGTIDNTGAVLVSIPQGGWKKIWKGSAQQFPVSVDFINPDTGWMVGANGLILHTTDGGQNWREQNVPTKESLEGVAFADERTGYAVGRAGLILHTADGGKTWNKQNSNTKMNLTNVIVKNTHEVWAVGRRGTVLVSEDAGQHWQPQDIGTQADIYAITIESDRVWIATSEGTVLRSTKKSASELPANFSTS